MMTLSVSMRVFCKFWCNSLSFTHCDFVSSTTSSVFVFCSICSSTCSLCSIQNIDSKYSYHITFYGVFLLLHSKCYVMVMICTAYCFVSYVLFLMKHDYHFLYNNANVYSNSVYVLLYLRVYVYMHILCRWIGCVAEWRSACIRFSLCVISCILM